MIVLSAPSGAGKTTLAKALLKKYPEMAVSVSATSRPKRNFEQNGIDYIFLSREEFENKILAGDFLEYEQVHDEYYGTLKKTVENMIAYGKIVLFDIDVNGALSIKKAFPESIIIFIKAPSKEELIRRLKGRKSENKDMINKRLSRLPYEYAQAKKFDHIVVNTYFNKTVEDLENIILTKA